MKRDHNSSQAVAGRQDRRRLRAQSGFTLVEIMIVVLIIGTLLNIALPSMLSARNGAWTKACVHNLTEIYTAKEQWAFDNSESGTEVPSWSNLQPYIEEPFPTAGLACPASGVPYNINAVDLVPTCPSYGSSPAPYTHAMQ